MKDVIVEPTGLLTVYLPSVDVYAQAVRLGATIVVVPARFRNSVVLPGRAAFHRESVGAALHTVGLGLLRLGVRLSRLRDTLRAYDVLCSRHREQVAQLSRVEHVFELKARCAAVVQVDRRERNNPVSFDGG